MPPEVRASRWMREVRGRRAISTHAGPVPHCPLHEAPGENIRILVACAAPLREEGQHGVAASPSSVARPVPQRGMGSRS